MERIEVGWGLEGVVGVGVGLGMGCWSVGWEVGEVCDMDTDTDVDTGLRGTRMLVLRLLALMLLLSRVRARM